MRSLRIDTSTPRSAAASRARAIELPGVVVPPLEATNQDAVPGPFDPAQDPVERDLAAGQEARSVAPSAGDATGKLVNDIGPRTLA